MMYIYDCEYDQTVTMNMRYTYDPDVFCAHSCLYRILLWQVARGTEVLGSRPLGSDANFSGEDAGSG